MSLIEQLPSFYANSKYVKNIMECDEKEIKLLREALEDLRNQFYVNTATWGLEFYERDLGIEVNVNKPYDERREAIKAKMRGQGTTTIQMIKDTSMAFTGGQIDIIEQYENYHFVIKFIDVKGIPKNMNDFKAMIDTIKPAHLTYSIEYLYNVWKFIQDKKYTWENVSSQTWESIKVFG